MSTSCCATARLPTKLTRLSSLPPDEDEGEMAQLLAQHLAQFASIQNIKIIHDSKGGACAFVQCEVSHGVPSHLWPLPLTELLTDPHPPFPHRMRLRLHWLSRAHSQTLNPSWAAIFATRLLARFVLFGSRTVLQCTSSPVRQKRVVSSAYTLHYLVES